MDDLQFDMAGYKGVTQDSRKVDEGYLFAALPGAQFDGRKFITDALAKGAIGILTTADTPRPLDLPAHIEWITVEDIRHTLALCAAEFYGAQPSVIAAVTGTNGKTSVANFTQQLWSALGKPSASLGTLGLKSDRNVSEIAEKIASLTTPDPVQLAESLAAVKAKGIEHLALEASSHGLEQERLDGVKISAAAFTNLSRDHLDYHGDMEHYLAAKALLFTKLLPEGGVAVLNADIPEYTALRDMCETRAQKVISYGHKGEALKIVSFETQAHGIALKLEVFGEEKNISLPLIGDFQAHNALAALGLAIAENPDDRSAREVALKALEHLRGAAGRLEPVFGHPKGAGIYIDYAHTPDALETVLKAIRPHVSGRLVCLFGCGGDRDAGKRAPMGKAAAENADIAILTDDNPRSEDPAAIRAQAKEGAPNAIEIAGREEAICYGVEILEEGDVFVIAGKGHEQGQTIKGETLPFCDKTKTIQALQGVKG